jgi:diphthine synthase
MVLYLVGLGLHDEKDLSIKAVEALKKCDKIYVELYTSKWYGSMEELERLAGKPVERLERESVESLRLVKEALSHSIALLVPGDPLAATTHIELLAGAKRLGAAAEVIHSSSVLTAIAETGLQPYKFGRTTSVTFPEQNFEPTSPYETICQNQKIGLHSLILLDVRPPRFMTIKEALEILLKSEARLKMGIIDSETKVVAAAELGGEKVIAYDTVSNLIKKDPQKVPAVLVVPGSLNFKEEEALGMWK